MRNLLLCFILLIASAASAQTSPYTIAKVVFHNTASYTNAELLATSGLASGQFLSHDSLGNAAQHLLNTGLFSDTQISLDGAGKARIVVVDLKPIPFAKLLPASFENLVWFTPAELTAGIHAHVPLYRGYASDAGNFPDAIQAALQQMLSEKGITATLSHTIVEPSTQHPQLVVDFKVESPTILLGKATLVEVPEPLKTGTFHVIQELSGSRYNEGLTGVTVEDLLLTPAHEAGYLNAKLQDVQRSPAPVNSSFSVIYNATLAAGEPYKLSALTWEPTSAYSTADLARDAKLHPGDIASTVALHETEEPIANAYLAQGYMDAYITATPTEDDAAHTVAYTLRAVPGQPYHLRSVTVVGLSPSARKLFDADWQMKPGDPYSDLAVNDFLRKHTAQPAFRIYDAGFGAVGDPETHLVDLTLTFRTNGSAVY